MNRKDFQRLAEQRVMDATALLASKRYGGAYYLAGYAVECALKACIAKQTRKGDFPPDRRTVERLYTHNIKQLINAAGLDIALEQAERQDPDLQVNWSIVRGWSEQSRYEQRSRKEATDLITAITDEHHGVLQWLRSVL